ncbi:relaxase domain-containing protein [Streptomyces phaeoluteigriseus]|uniref:relaxase domain-containing protein n=1 Tax=Streptomyces phaeoluteigriseus TaxID=114686 RepID=UPI00367DC581
MIRPQPTSYLLWAPGDEETLRVIEAAHDPAIERVLEWIADEVAVIRYVRDGIYRVRPPGGLAAARFRLRSLRRESRPTGMVRAAERRPQGRLFHHRNTAAGLAAGPMSGFDEDGVNREFFPSGDLSALLPVNIGRPERRSGERPRAPRLAHGGGHDTVTPHRPAFGQVTRVGEGQTGPRGVLPRGTSGPTCPTPR